jgi:hypothetical protein
MALPDKFLEVLQELKARFAAEALAPSKQDQTEFGYGKAVGTYQGILHAEQRFSALIEAEEEKERG